MNKYFIGAICVLILVLAAWFLYSPKSPTLPVQESNFSKGGVVIKDNPDVTSISHETNTTIKLYFYNPALDQGPGGVQCSKNGLVAVERTIPLTETPLTDAVKLLLRGEISDTEKASGIQSEFPLAGLTLANATVTDSVATLTFNDPQNKTVGGSCRASILWAQISETTKQFEPVKSVRFLPEELFQP